MDAELERASADPSNAQNAERVARAEMQFDALWSDLGEVEADAVALWRRWVGARFLEPALRGDRIDPRALFGLPFLDPGSPRGDVLAGNARGKNRGELHHRDAAIALLVYAVDTWCRAWRRQKEALRPLGIELSTIVDVLSCFSRDSSDERPERRVMSYDVEVAQYERRIAEQQRATGRDEGSEETLAALRRDFPKAFEAAQGVIDHVVEETKTKRAPDAVLDEVERNGWTLVISSMLLHQVGLPLSCAQLRAIARIE